jgi:hypothetical protein
MRNPIEALRQIWTPEREVDELFAVLAPGSALDSEIRDYFSRMVERFGTITLDITDPVPPFEIRWEVVHTQPPNSRRMVTIWKIETAND